MWELPVFCLTSGLKLFWVTTFCVVHLFFSSTTVSLFEHNGKWWLVSRAEDTFWTVSPFICPLERTSGTLLPTLLWYFCSGGMGAGCCLWISPNPCWSDKANPKFFDLFGKSFLFIHEFYCGQDMGKTLALHVCTGKCFSLCSFKWRKGFCSPPCIASLRGNGLYCHCCFYIAMGTDLKCCIH